MLLSRMTKKTRERTQITNIRSERGNITTDPTDIKKKIKEYFKQLYAHMFDNQDETINP